MKKSKMICKKKKKKDKTFMNKCVWEEINFPSEKDDWQKIEKK